MELVSGRIGIQTQAVLASVWLFFQGRGLRKGCVRVTFHGCTLAVTIPHENEIARIVVMGQLSRKDACFLRRPLVLPISRCE